MVGQAKDEFELGGHVSYVMNAGDLTNSNLARVLNAKGFNAEKRLAEIKQDNKSKLPGNSKTMSFYHNTSNSRKMAKTGEDGPNPLKKEGNSAYYDLVKDWLK